MVQCSDDPVSTDNQPKKDTRAPLITNAAVIHSKVIVLTFNEPLGEESAKKTGNYIMHERDNPLSAINVSAASLDGSVVTLSLAGNMVEGMPYLLEVARVMDLVGNSIKAGTNVELVLAAEGGDAIIALYLDTGRSVLSIAPEPGTMFDCYVWCLPSERGMIGAEFALQTIKSTDDFECLTSNEFLNPAVVAVALGNTVEGIMTAGVECQYNWMWIIKVQYLYKSGRGYIDVVSHPNSGARQVANCLTGFPIEPASSGTPLQVNIQ